jgi:predicted phage terminase large subunit-like protein
MVAPLKAVCEGTEKYIIILADTSEQAQGYLKTISDELDYNDVIREKYPLACKHGDIWNKDRIETASGVCVEVLGKGKSVRGRKFRQYRPTLIIGDDLQNDDDVLSPTTRQKDMSWFDKALIPCGDTNTNYFIIGTNLHRESIVNTLTARSDFKCLRYASVMEWPTDGELWNEWEVLYTSGQDAIAFYNERKAALDEGAVVLWPEKESLLELMILRANIGHVAFACEKQNDPRDPNKCEFDEEWFSDEVWYDSLPANLPSGFITVGYCDPAKGGETKRHDYSANILLHYSPDNKCCYVTCDIKRRPVSATIDAIIRLVALYNPLSFGVEANGFQQLIVDEAIAKAPLLPLEAVANYGVHKNTRISRLSIWFQRKFFRFKRGCKDTKLLMQMLLDHPHSAHDDGPDALEGALRKLTTEYNLSITDGVAAPIEADPIGDNIFDNNMYLGV